MNDLFIPPTQETPEINLNPEKNTFIISGMSLPENALRFYEPVIAWFEKYSENPNPTTILEIKYDYFNSSSIKQLAKIITILEKLTGKSKVTIKWYYRPEDDDMLLLGKQYAEKLCVKDESTSGGNINFEFIKQAII